MAEREFNPLLLGFYGIEATEETIRFLKESKAAGVCLYRRNIESAEQVRELVGDLEDRLGYRILVAVEHEGGRLSRFSKGVTFFPGNLALGKTGVKALAYETGKAMGRELLAMGINVNLAPVLDLAADQDHSEFNLRSFGMSPTVVGSLGAEMIRGLQEAGVSATARHFPGRGFGAAKQRGATPVVSRTGEQILEQDLVPFQSAIAGGVDLIQTANAVYPEVDGQQAAQFSKRLVTELLREEMGYKGLVITEDLSLPSTSAALSIEEAAVQSLLAGNDLVLLGNDLELQKKAQRGLKAAVDGGRIPPETLRKGADRVRALLARKKPVKATLFSEEADEGGGAQLAAAVARAALRIEQDPGKLLPLKAGQKVGILVPRLWDVADRVVVDEEVRGAAGLVQGWAQAHSKTVDVLEIPIQPDKDMMDLTLEWAAALEILVFFCFDARRWAGQRKALEALQARCPRMVAVLIGNPWDRGLLQPGTTVVDTYGFRSCQLAAAVDALFKGAVVKGKG